PGSIFLTKPRNGSSPVPAPESATYTEPASFTATPPPPFPSNTTGPLINVRNVYSSSAVACTGNGAGSRTFTHRVCVVLSGGLPSSVTFNRIQLVLGPCVRVGVQVNRPFVGFKLTPLGAHSNAKVNMLGG